MRAYDWSTTLLLHQLTFPPHPSSLVPRNCTHAFLWSSHGKTFGVGCLVGSPLLLASTNYKFTTKPRCMPMLSQLPVLKHFSFHSLWIFRGQCSRVMWLWGSPFSVMHQSSLIPLTTLFGQIFVVLATCGFCEPPSSILMVKGWAGLLLITISNLSISGLEIHPIAEPPCH